MSPWVGVLLLIVAVYLLIVAIRAFRDLVIWYLEGREFARERKRFKDLRQKKKSDKLQVPALKERPSDPPKSPPREAKPPGH